MLIEPKYRQLQSADYRDYFVDHDSPTELALFRMREYNNANVAGKLRDILVIFSVHEKTRLLPRDRNSVFDA